MRMLSPVLLGIPRKLAPLPSAEELRSMDDADLKIRYNAIMAEVMRRRRAKQKEPKC
jgi:hypothetical protein